MHWSIRRTEPLECLQVWYFIKRQSRVINSTRWWLCQRLYYFYQILTTFNKLKIMSEVVLLLPNTDHLQQGEDYVRGYSTSTKYLPPSTRWWLCQRLFYFYQILTVFNKVKIMSEVVLLLPNTDRLQQGEDYVRGCSTSTKYWPPSTRWWLCQRLFYFYQILTVFNKLKSNEDNVRGCTTSTKYWPPSTFWRYVEGLWLDWYGGGESAIGNMGYYVSPSNEGRHIVLVWFFLLPHLLSEACPDHNFFVFPDRSIIFGM
jgi:hypothetical protein